MQVQDMKRAGLLAVLMATLAVPAVAEPARFDSPEAAVAAFIAALEAKDKDAMLVVFGPESADLVSSGDPEDDAEAREEFLQGYGDFAEIVDAGEGRKELQIGRTRWPFPVALVAADGGWRFDPDSARDEILARRIGLNELDVIELMQRALVVQADYRGVDYDNDGVMEFASAILSDDGQRNGLYWPSEDGTPDSPIGAFMAKAAADGINLDGVDQEPQPYLGYFFRILTKQGSSAPGGSYDYMVAGNMVAGHALLAYPADPGESGIMSFMMAENGIIYEADLGDETLTVAGAIDSFDPVEGWTPVQD
jgi:Protein of unknown function (DUF2950)